jgi:Xaa-Pro aminopeptidase
MTQLVFQADRVGRERFFSPDFTAEELAGRRQRIAASIGAGAHLLLPSAPPVPGDRPEQDANFYYFCGLETCHSYLLVDGGTARSRLFLPSRDTMEGEPHNRLGCEDAELIRNRLQVEAVAPASELTGALAGVKTLYLPQAELEGSGTTKFRANACAQRRAEEEWDRAEPRHKRLMRLLTERFPGIELRDACPLISAMRTIKSPAEIAVLRQAGALSAAAVTEAMKVTRPGIIENRLEAVAEYVFRDRGHCGLGYGVIAAGGKRTWDGHYHFNDATLRADEIVLMDCGPDLRHYSSDIARMWPVNGVFSPWHRRVYGFIVEYHKTLLRLIRPGALPADIYAQAEKQMAARCDAGTRPLLDQMVKAGVRYLNHGVGLSVHDAIGPWRDEPLREGFVCALDPMIWCEPQHEYIRVEDTIVVTANGCERLTGAAPIEIGEIEALVGKTGGSYAQGGC